jgi:hypothetical protein
LQKWSAFANQQTHFVNNFQNDMLRNKEQVLNTSNKSLKRVAYTSLLLGQSFMYFVE